MKRTYRVINGKLVEVTNQRQQQRNHMIMPDIQPYRSMIDGSVIQSRSQHRRHLRDHDCVEVGNETDKMLTAYDNLPDTLSESRRDLIRAQINDMDHKAFKRLIHNSVRQARGY